MYTYECVSSQGPNKIGRKIMTVEGNKGITWCNAGKLSPLAESLVVSWLEDQNILAGGVETGKDGRPG